MVIPDFPPHSYFEDEDSQTSALHDLKTGLVLPELLAFICAPIFCEKAYILEDKYKFEFTHQYNTCMDNSACLYTQEV